MVLAYGINLNDSFGCTEKDSISSIDLKDHLNLKLSKNPLLPFLFFLLSLGIRLLEGRGEA